MMTQAMTENTRTGLLMLGLLAMLCLSACERGVHDMYDQPRYKPLQPSPLFEDGNSSQRPPADTLPAARGRIASTSSARLSEPEPVREITPAVPVPVGADGQPLAPHATYENPIPLSMSLLRRGQERYGIYCAPCHGYSGEANGMVVQRGFPTPPSFHEPRLRAAADSHFYEVISHGYGLMYPYGSRVEPYDRWAIVAYLRAMQLSQHASMQRLSADDLQAINSAAEP